MSMVIIYKCFPSKTFPYTMKSSVKSITFYSCKNFGNKVKFNVKKQDRDEIKSEIFKLYELNLTLNRKPDTVELLLFGYSLCHSYINEQHEYIFSKEQFSRDISEGEKDFADDIYERVNPSLLSETRHPMHLKLQEQIRHDKEHTTKYDQPTFISNPLVQKNSF